MDVQNVVVNLAVRYGFQVLGAIVVLAAGLIAGRWLGGVVDQRLQGRAMEPPMRVLLVRLLRVVVMLFAVLVALDKLGFSVAPLVAGIGVAGIGLGFALQGVLSNMVAGLTIIFTKPFRVGEYIEILGVRGDVAAIELSSTTLLHADRSRVVIPNRKIVGEILHNYGKVRQLALEVGIAYGSDVDAALAAIRAALAASPRVLKDPAPTLGVAKLADSALTVAAGPWVNIADARPAVGELNKAILDALRAARVEIPFPQREIRMVTSTAYVGRKEGGAYAGSA